MNIPYVLIQDKASQWNNIRPTLRIDGFQYYKTKRAWHVTVIKQTHQTINEFMTSTKNISLEV